MSAWDEIDELKQKHGTPPAQRVKGVSTDRARTLMANERIAKGFHPFGSPLRQPPGETCGTCRHLRTKKWDKAYFKCELRGDTRGPATDCRKKWPACVNWEPRP